jgi:hypothetical protein
LTTIENPLIHSQAAAHAVALPTACPPYGLGPFGGALANAARAGRAAVIARSRLPGAVVVAVACWLGPCLAIASGRVVYLVAFVGARCRGGRRGHRRRLRAPAHLAAVLFGEVVGAQCWLAPQLVGDRPCPCGDGPRPGRPR